MTRSKVAWVMNSVNLPQIPPYLGDCCLSKSVSCNSCGEPPTWCSQMSSGGKCLRKISRQAQWCQSRWMRSQLRLGLKWKLLELQATWLSSAWHPSVPTSSLQYHAIYSTLSFQHYIFRCILPNDDHPWGLFETESSSYHCQHPHDDDHDDASLSLTQVLNLYTIRAGAI